MGFDCALEPSHTFLYRAAVGGGLYEHELDHVFIGTADVVPRYDPDEVMDWRYFPIDGLWPRLATHPAEFTVWFRILMGELAARAQIAAPAAVR
jgi:isopentenyl-diphosphate delta-isomerase